MKVYFEHSDNLTSSLKKTVKQLLESGNDLSGSTVIEYIPYEELEYYDVHEKFINKHKGCDFYMVSDIVCGMWSQPISMIAVLD